MNRTGTERIGVGALGPCGPYAPEQPRGNDVVVHCGHVDAPGPHFFKFKGRQGFTRPDGSQGFAKWLIVCPACLRAAGGDPQRVGVRGDDRWDDRWDDRRGGNTPAVLVIEVHSAAGPPSGPDAAGDAA